MSALVVEKDMLIRTSWSVCKIGSYGLGRFLLKIDGTLFVALTVDKHGALVQVNIVESQPDKLGDADTGLEEQLQNRIVAAVAQSCV
jgi:hypothetical protein